MNSKRALLALLLCLVLVSASRLSYLMFYAMAVTAAVYIWGAGRVFARLRVERSVSGDKAFVGQDVTVTIRAVGDGAFPLGWVSLRASQPPNMIVTGPLSKAVRLPGRGGLTLVYRVAAGRRGYYRLGAILLSGGDPLGWNPQDRVFRDAGEALVVYPPITPLLDVPLPNVRPFGAQRDRLRAHEDPSRLAGVREYQPGDSLRRIHWKASANRGTLQVKELVPTVTAESLILLNLGEGEYPTGSWATFGELAIEVAASLTVHLVRLGTVVGLVTNGRDPDDPDPRPLVLPPAGGAGQAEAILTLLARVAVAPGPDFAELIGMYGRGAVWGASVFPVTPSWPPGLARLGRSLRRAGKTLVPLLVEPARDDLTRARADGQAVLTVRRDRERGGVRMTYVR